MDMIIPCNGFQKSLYYEWLRNPNSDAYHLPFSFHLTGCVDIDLLVESLNFSLNSFPSLRFRYIEGSDISIHLNDRELKTELSYVSMRSPEFSDWLKKESSHFFAQTFNLNNGENVFAKIVYNTHTKEAYIWILCHHIASDVFSFHLFFTNTLARYYNEGYRNLDTKYYRNRLDEYLALTKKCLVLSSGESYWLKRFSIDFFRLNCFSNELTQKYQSSPFTHSFVFCNNFRELLLDYCKSQGISLFNFFLTSYCLLLSSLTQCEEIVVGLPVTMRSTREEKNVFGYFVNTLPLHINLNEYKSSVEISSELARQVYSLLKNKFASVYSLILRSSQSPLKTGLIDNSFTFYDKSLSFSLKDCIVNRIEQTPQTPQFKFAITVEDTGVEVRIRCYSVLFSSSLVEVQFRTVIEKILANSLI